MNSQSIRSYLFVPADSPRKLEKSLGTEADGLVFDLEDAVSIKSKERGRQVLSEFLSLKCEAGVSRARLFVRINPLTTDLALDDLASVMPYRPTGIFLPKCRGARDLRLLASYLDVFDHLYPVSGRDAPTGIIAIATESADSLACLNEYRDASPRLQGMMWGSEDLSADIGAFASTDELAPQNWTPQFELARSLCLFAATAAGVPAIDTVPTEIHNPDALTRNTRRALRDGFRAKAAIHPDQVPVINEAMTPDIETQKWALRVKAAFDREDVGVATLDGQMLDVPHLKLAQKILDASQGEL